MTKPDLSVPVPLALQMTLHPRDVAMLATTLEAQLDAWAPLVDRVMLTVDSQPSLDCHGEAWRAARKALFVRLEALRRRHPGLGIDSVIYAAHYRKKVAQAFLDGDDVPELAADGSSFHGPLFGLLRTNAARILILAPGALYRGDASGWLRGAMALLDTDDNLLGLSPTAKDLPGAAGPRATALVDMTRLHSVAAPLALVPPGLGGVLRARLLARDPRSVSAMETIAAGATTAGLSFSAVAHAARLDPLVAAPASGAVLGRLRGGLDMLVGAQLKRLGRI